MKNRVITIVLTYNSEDYIDLCLDSARACSQTDVLVVDNASTDSTISRVKKFQDVKLLIQKQNNGYASGNNIGLRYAVQKGYTYALILNPDAILNTGVVQSLSRRLDEYKELAAVSPIITYGDGSMIWYAGAKFLHGRFEPNIQHYRLPISSIKHKGLVYTDSLIGAALMVRLSVVPVVGYMDEDYFLYCEETDWCLAMKKCSYSVACDYSAIISHNVSASTGGEGSLLQTYYYTRNILYMCKKYSPNTITREIIYREGIYIEEVKAAVRGPQRLLHAKKAYYMKRAILDFKTAKMGHMGYKF